MTLHKSIIRLPFQDMSPERRLARGTRKRIRELKSAIRENAALPTATAAEGWTLMEEELRSKLPNFSQICADGRISIIIEWYNLRRDLRSLASGEKMVKIGEFQQKYDLETRLLIKDALAIISQNLGSR